MANQKTTERRRNALTRLEKQLGTGKKTAKKGSEQLDLLEDDKKRIGREIERLKSLT
jgi:hypothetical protein